MMVKRWHVEKDSTIVLPPERETWGYTKLMDLYTENLYTRFKRRYYPPNAGWATILAGSGSVLQRAYGIVLLTGTTALSKAQAYRLTYALNSGDISHIYVDWSKRLEWEFIFSRKRSDPEVVARIQIKESSAEGALAERGIGLEIANYTVKGEGYGTARGTVALGTMPDSRIWHIKIILQNGRLEFWVNRVLKGVLTGDYVPQVKGTTTGYLVFSIVNGATGGVDCTIDITELVIVQEW